MARRAKKELAESEVVKGRDVHWLN